MQVDIVIVNYNTKSLLKDCLESIFKYKRRHHYQVWVVDNGSKDESVAMVKAKFPQVKVEETGRNLGFSAGNNVVLNQTKADFCLLLNSDTIVLENSLDSLVEFGDEQRFGIVSARLQNADGSFQPNAGDLPDLIGVFNWLSGVDDLAGLFGQSVRSFHQTSSGYYRRDRPVGWVSGSVMLISQAVISQIGGMDEAIFMYGEDVEYCFRAAQAGFRVGWTKQSSIIHLGGRSSSDPHYTQWLGEFKGLLYLTKKNGQTMSYWLLKLLLYVFIPARAVAFLLLGRFRVAQTYVKIIPAI